MRRRRTGPVELAAPKSSSSASRWLRVRLGVDRLVGFVALLIASPVVAVAALLVRRESGTPAFVRTKRVGAGGREFEMTKIRTMYPAGPDGLAGGAPLTAKDDERITPLGRKLRHMHLDELPQLVHVARGEMALFGPRPEDPRFVDFEDPLWEEVVAVPPAMAGPSQVLVGDWERELLASDPDGDIYRHKVLPVKLAIDRWYVRSASPMLDILVAVALVQRLARRRVSERLLSKVQREVPEARDLVEALRRQARGDDGRIA